MLWGCLKKTQNSCQIEFLSRNGRETSSMARLHDSNCKLLRSIQTFNILCCDFLSDLLALYVWHSMVISLLRNKKHFCRHFDNRSYITSSVAPDPRGSKRTYIIISSGNVQIAFSVWLSFRSEQWSEEVNGFRRAGMSSDFAVFVLKITAFNFFLLFVPVSSVLLFSSLWSCFPF